MKDLLSGTTSNNLNSRSFRWNPSSSAQSLPGPAKLLSTPSLLFKKSPPPVVRQLDLWKVLRVVRDPSLARFTRLKPLIQLPISGTSLASLTTKINSTEMLAVS